MKEQTEKKNNKSLPTEQTTKHTSSTSGSNAPHNETAPGGKQSFVSLPKGGGAIRGMGEKFEANPITGTGSFSVPLMISPGRENFTPQLSLGYDSGSGNSPFGLGWNVGIPSITRKTDKGLPIYDENGTVVSSETDTFILSGAEDLVPVLNGSTGIRISRTENNFIVFPYRSRTEGLFALIERWFNPANGISYWKSISKDNITTIYGSTSGTRISNPDDETKVFSWLIEKSWDAKGNLMQFEYKKEDTANIDTGSIEIFEKNRLSSLKCFNNLYLKQVRYGNTVMYNPNSSNYQTDWHFYLVFDYGDYSSNIPEIDPDWDWFCRSDPFSSFRAGFEIRTYRLCNRILMFHKFIDDLSSDPVLVKSTNLEFDQNEYLTLLNSVRHLSYNQGDTAEMPALLFNYSLATMGSAIHKVEPTMLKNLAGSMDGNKYQWVDLYSEGISGILNQDNNAWYFTPNYGDKNYYDTIPMSIDSDQLVLGNIKAEMQKPAAIRNKQSSYHLGDVDSDGLPELIINAPGVNGYYSRDDYQNWEPFKAFAQSPNINQGDPNVKLIDLTGDGLADIIISKGSHFEIYFSEGKKGYNNNYRRVVCTGNEENGPVVVFSDPSHRIFLSDMSGDGLVDILRITNGSICYWPNMGYGRFGEKVSMKNAPHFDRPDLFNPSQLRLADVDGTGSTDIIYLSSSSNRYWKNKAGNGWSDPIEIPYFPLTAKSDNVEVVDLLGNGSSCLVWSTSLPGKPYRMQYIELTSGIKPYLLTQIDNGMGGITSMQYAPSTKFYLRDKFARKPWITKLPFPVHVLEKVEIRDDVTGNVFVNSYAYHHGYYDNAEREFRGFGMVEQWDAEQYFVPIDTEEIFVPPVYTKTWFHTGFFKNRQEICSQYIAEYFNGDSHAWLLPDTILPTSLSAFEEREACRALRGTALRKEVYAQDGTILESIPYTVEEKSYNIKLLQHIGTNKHAIFHVTESETLSYHYERNVDDPRIAHSIVLSTDDYGNVLQSAQIAYPRRVVPVDMPEQGKLHIVYHENEFINFINNYTRLIGVNFQTKVYEITGVDFVNHKYDLNNLNEISKNFEEIDFSELPTTGQQKRKIQHDRIYFWDERLTLPLELGEITRQALVYQKQSLEFTQNLIDNINLDDIKITNDILLNEGKYLSEDNLWWIVSEIQHFNPNKFYLPYSVTDPFGDTTSLKYDNYSLLIRSITDALEYTTSIANDYRLLQAWQITDANGNMQSVAFDTLGMVKALALTGKNGEGDTLSDPTITYDYDLHNWINYRLPVYSHIASRDTHASLGIGTNWLESYTYTSGLGQEIQTKVQAEDGTAWTIVDGVATPKTDVTDRWTATGRTILNNKGKVVKQYEPWFSATKDYEPEDELCLYGVSPVMHYDPLLRNIRTDLPDGTFTKVEFTPWVQKSYDANDTVMDSQWYIENGSPLISDPEPKPAFNDSPEIQKSIRMKRAAWLTLKHNNTPQTQYFDSLGRPFIIEDDNGTEGKYRVHTKLDITGRPLVVTDALNRQMTHNTYGFKQPLFTQNIDSGRRWMLADVAGKPIRAWDDREHAFRNTYDELQRPLKKLVTYEDKEILSEMYVYGTNDNGENPDLYNIGQIEYIYDQSGINHIVNYDFKGNPLEKSKQYCESFTGDINWGGSPDLLNETFTQQTQYDALNRPIKLIQPDGNAIFYEYNKAALLEKVIVNQEEYVTNINYNEKGQRTEIYYGNESKTKYEYDNNTFRLTRLLTTRINKNTLQDINYFYDAVGNIVEQVDFAQQTFYFNNTVIEPVGKYQYDALYRLIQAEGRELIALNMPDHHDFANDIPVPSGADMQNYTQQYTYDKLGNITKLKSESNYGWTRNYYYDTTTNRLLKHVENQTPDDYTYDAHGNMRRMPHLSEMQWDFADRLRYTTNGTVSTWYCYDAGGERTRKVTEKQGGIKEERYYIGGYEVYRKIISGTTDTERTTLHVMDDTKTVALIETLTFDNGNTPNTITVRYQYDNHLGSACLELDEKAHIISYEEYHPFGTTSYRSGRTETEVSLKRYKYVGKERDEETGLYYYGARYYAAWLCRFVSVDPLQHEYPHYTPYQYAGNKPINYIDLDGLEEAKHKYNEITDRWKKIDIKPPPQEQPINRMKPKSIKEIPTDTTKPDIAKIDIRNTPNVENNNNNDGFRVFNHPDATDWRVRPTTAVLMKAGALIEDFLFGWTRQAGQSLKQAFTKENSTQDRVTSFLSAIIVIGLNLSKSGGKGKLKYNEKIESTPATPAINPKISGVESVGAKEIMSQWGWSGTKTWKKLINKVSSGNTIEELSGKIPTREEAIRLIEESKGTIQRIEGPHTSPNPHNFNHINYTTPSGKKGTIKIQDL